MNPYYPIFLKIRDEVTLVVGGGKIAERKTLALLEHGARVTIVSPRLTPRLRGLADQNRLIWCCRLFRPDDLAGVRLAICATDNEAVNREVAEEARSRGIWLNVVDKPDLCSFIVPSIVRQGDLTIAVSTGGSSPALSKKVRGELEARFGPEYARFLSLLKRLRRCIQRDIPEESRRMRIFDELVQSSALGLVATGRMKEAEAAVRQILEHHRVTCPEAWDVWEQ